MNQVKKDLGYLQAVITHFNLFPYRQIKYGMKLQFNHSLSVVVAGVVPREGSSKSYFLTLELHHGTLLCSYTGC